MSIALSLEYVGAPAERNVLWRVQLHAAPTERVPYLLRAINILLLRSKERTTESVFSSTEKSVYD